jgi:serine/threonine-protein kinase
MSRRGVLAIVVSVLVLLLLAGCSGKTVPELKGKTREQAALLLQGAGLKLGSVSYDEKAVGVAGAIVEQTPAAGSRLADGKTVDVVIAGPRIEVMPSVIGMDADKAVALLKDMKVDVVTLPNDAAGGPVKEQDPPAGADVAAGDLVTLTLDTNVAQPEVTKQVPDVVGMDQNKAMQVLKAAGFGFETSEVTQHGEVVDQVPKGGTAAKPGTVVEIKIVPVNGSDVSPNDNYVEVPNVMGQPQDDAMRVLRDAGLGVDTSEVIANGVVIGIQPKAGTRVKRGTIVEIKVTNQVGD